MCTAESVLQYVEYAWNQFRFRFSREHVSQHSSRPPTGWTETTPWQKREKCDEKEEKAEQTNTKGSKKTEEGRRRNRMGWENISSDSIRLRLRLESLMNVETVEMLPKSVSVTWANVASWYAHFCCVYRAYHLMPHCGSLHDYLLLEIFKFFSAINYSWVKGTFFVHTCCQLVVILLFCEVMNWCVQPTEMCQPL